MDRRLLELGGRTLRVGVRVLGLRPAWVSLGRPSMGAARRWLAHETWSLGARLARDPGRGPLNLPEFRTPPGIEPMLDQAKRDGHTRRHDGPARLDFGAREPLRIFELLIPQMYRGRDRMRGESQHQ